MLPQRVCQEEKGDNEMSGMWMIAFVLQWIVLLIFAVLIVGVLRYLSFVQGNIHAVTHYASRFEQGDRISHFELPNLEGLPVVSKALFDRSQRTLLLFLSPSCRGCDAVIEDLTNLVKRERGLKRFGWSVVAVYTGPYVSRDAVEKHIDPSLLNEVTVVVDEKGLIAQRYDLRIFPVGIAVDHLGRVVDQSSRSMARWLKQTLQASQPSQEKPVPLSVGDQR